MNHFPLRILSQHHLYKKFKDEIRVVIDGSGGDEIGAGYIYHVLPWYLDMLKDNKITKEKQRFYKLSNLLKIIQFHYSILLLGH